MARVFDDNAANGIVRPQIWMGIETPEGGKTPWDGAHATGDALWRDKSIVSVTVTVTGIIEKAANDNGCEMRRIA